MIPLLIGGGLLGGWVLQQSGVIGEGGLFSTPNVGEAIEGAVSVVPVIIEKTAPAIVNGIESGVEAVKESLEGRTSNFMKNLTIVILTYATFRMIRTISLEK